MKRILIVFGITFACGIAAMLLIVPVWTWVGGHAPEIDSGLVVVVTAVVALVAGVIALLVELDPRRRGREDILHEHVHDSIERGSHQG